MPALTITPCKHVAHKGHELYGQTGVGGGTVTDIVTVPVPVTAPLPPMAKL